MYGTPNTSGLSSPIAKEITTRNKIDVSIGPTSVCPDTIINRNTSFL